ncbi:ferrirhodotorulic acid ABC transporter, inner membrane protein [Campylobacter iguaniorum]|uniref:FTR1 family iron permease n=1 Tax=Campylobacter iguaniorum TaxID=1244531 RepID=UPI0007C947A0|nr:FTR1 family protein [Campylobacter iguaniorum]ANE35671.1 ferrirhodotorulic acid ABC transporter, inner membrane protein [Campylobacter iguaniorum]
MKIVISFILVISMQLHLFGVDYDKEARSIEEIFVKVVELYKEGNSKEARELTQSAYFSHFENLEAGVRINLGQKKAYAMEKQFGEIRKAIKASKEEQSIQAMIDSLNAEIKEILPIIKTGAKLVAEKSDDGGLSAAGIEANNSPWSDIYNQIASNLQSVSNAYDSSDAKAIKNAMNKIKFDLYRNTQLEIAIRRYANSKMDQMIQQIMGNVISQNLNLSKESLEQSLKDIDELIQTAIIKLPKESYVLAPEIKIEEKKVDFAPTVQNIKQKISDALKLYESGNMGEAISDVGDIYFDEYEASGMENKIGAIDNPLKTATEASFSKIVSLMKSGASSDKIIAEQNELYSKLQTSLEKASEQTGGWALFIYALSIILREGFEALIIVAAVVAYLLKTDNKKHLNLVYSSVSIAVILSFVTAYAINLIFGSSLAGQSREILEGITMLVAVVLLFYVGFWLLSNAGAKKWSHYIAGHIKDSLSSGDSKALWWTVFLAVYREGAETVLFYQALIFDASSNLDFSMIGAGFISGVIILLIAYFVIKAFSLKIPIKPFFIATSMIIFYMSIVFVGKGVMELVEGKLFVPSIIEGVPTISWLGIYPYYESLVPQGMMILALIAGIFIIKKRQLNFNKGE